MKFEIGQKVEIRQGSTRTVIATGNIHKISATGKRLTVLRQNGITNAFYRNSSNTRYVKDPGAGIGGSFLNDYIAIEE